MPCAARGHARWRLGWPWTGDALMLAMLRGCSREYASRRLRAQAQRGHRHSKQQARRWTRVSAAGGRGAGGGNPLAIPRGRRRCRLAQRGQAEAKREAAIRLLLREEDGAAPKQRPTIAATYAATVHAWLCLGSRNCRHLCCHCQTCRLPHATGATKRPLLPPAAGRRSFCSRDLPIV